MSKLNEEYFKTRKQQEENVSNKAWVYIVPILFLLLLSLNYATNKSKERSRKNVEEEFILTWNDIVNSKLTTSSIWVDLIGLGCKVKLHDGLKFEYVTETPVLVAMSDDVSELVYLVGKVPKSISNGDVKSKWLKKMISDDPNTYQYDSLQYTVTEYQEDGRQYRSLFTLEKIEDKYIFVKAMVRKEKYGQYEEKMIDVLESLKHKL